jgi:hypothetical protein
VRLYLLVSVLVAASFTAMSETNDPPKKTSADLMREIRLKILTSPSSELGQKPTLEYPHVYGMLMDWPIEEATVSVMASSVGDASIYTTGTFGVMGGIQHETVRDVAKSFVKLGEKHYDEAKPTKDFGYPQNGRVRFYLICYGDVRFIEADTESLTHGKGRCSDLFTAGQRVLTELRQIVDKQKSGAP